MNSNHAVSAAAAPPNMEPDYEIKLLLDPIKALGSDNTLTDVVLSTFDMTRAVTKMNIQFLDTTCKEIYSAGWSARIRKSEDDEDLELTYKMRYAITGDDVEAALTTANNDGFNTEASKYKAQVEWGYKKKTLSISRKKSAASPGNSGIDLPGADDCRSMLIDEAPDKFDNWLGSRKWGTSALSRSRVYGPVLAERSIGTWKGMQLYIEVWPIINACGTGIEHLVEVSFKTKNQATATTQHITLVEFLQSKGWFLPQDSLKTQLMMDRY